MCPPDATCALGNWSLKTNSIVPNLVTVIGVAEATSCPAGSPPTCGWYLVPASGGDYGLVFASGQNLPILTGVWRVGQDASDIMPAALLKFANEAFKLLGTRTRAQIQILDWKRDRKLHANQEARNNHDELGDN